jgi:acyl-CoA synthetase (AMP-forming)/AMP-acid ligase II
VHFDLLAHGDPDAIALAAPGTPDLTYAAPRTQIEGTVEALNAFGIGRGDRVAIVLPSGPAMASAFLAVTCAATACPLNPAYRAYDSTSSSPTCAPPRC